MVLSAAPPNDIDIDYDIDITSDDIFIRWSNEYIYHYIIKINIMINCTTKKHCNIPLKNGWPKLRLVFTLLTFKVDLRRRPFVQTTTSRYYIDGPNNKNIWSSKSNESFWAKFRDTFMFIHNIQIVAKGTKEAFLRKVREILKTSDEANMLLKAGKCQIVK